MFGKYGKIKKMHFQCKKILKNNKIQCIGIFDSTNTEVLMFYFLEDGK